MRNRANSSAVLLGSGLKNVHVLCHPHFSNEGIEGLSAKDNQVLTSATKIENRCVHDVERNRFLHVVLRCAQH